MRINWLAFVSGLTDRYCIERTGKETQDAAMVNNIVATAYICFFLLTGFAPAVVLARTVRRKIERLEANCRYSHQR